MGSRRKRAIDALLPMAKVATAAGLTVAALMLLLGFESPNRPLLLLATICALSVPLAVMIHVIAIPGLSSTQRRTWIRALVSRKAPVVLARYLREPDRARIADEMAKDLRT